MKIYLACPYSHSDISVKELRFNAVTKKAGELMLKGHIVYSPITASHPIAVMCNLPGEWEYWEKFDRAFISWADEVWVLCLEKWQESRGVQAEITIAKEMKKKIQFITMRSTNYAKKKSK